jgi:hypothetical protein
MGTRFHPAEARKGAMTGMIKDSTADTSHFAARQRLLLCNPKLLLRRISGLKRRTSGGPLRTGHASECAHDATSPACAACISVYIHMP